jgi:hypothetical protein
MILEQPKLEPSEKSATNARKEQTESKQPGPVNPYQASPIMKSEYPTPVKCPHCSKDVTTRIQRKVGCGTWAISGGNS